MFLNTVQEMKSNTLDEQVLQVPHFLLLAGKIQEIRYNTLKKTHLLGTGLQTVKTIFLEDKVTLLEYKL